LERIGATDRDANATPATSPRTNIFACDFCIKPEISLVSIAARLYLPQRLGPGIALFFALVSIAPATAAAHDAPPQLGKTGRNAFQDFLRAQPPRAFAVAPGGAWGWIAAAPSEEVAEARALDYCERNTEQRCVVYQVNDARVFDAASWATLWGPYASARTASSAPVGTARGQRFPDLALTGPNGEVRQLGDFAGAVTLLHFWGSWCGPCRRELPELQRLADGAEGRLRFVLVQVREDAATSREWLGQQGIRLPSYDSGSKGPEDDRLRLSDGNLLPDRSVARVFPTTYVLDPYGLVLFSHEGPIEDWSEYAPLLFHAAAHSGH